MSNKELEEYINKIEPNFNSHLEKGTIEMSNEYYNLLEEKMVRLINENQELKKQLENKYEKIKDYIKRVNELVDKLSGKEKDTYNWWLIYIFSQCAKLLNENKILKENAENNDKVVDKINWNNQLLKKENQELKEQLQKQKEVTNKAIKYIKNYEDIKVYNIKAYYEYIDEDDYEEYNYNEDFKKELLHILESDNNQ